MTNSTFLNRVAESTRRRVDERKRRTSATVLKDRAQSRRPLDVLAALRAAPPSIISEVKRRSPSLGAIALQADPVTVARQYDQAGAAMISVLTEPEHFGGQIEDLALIRESVPQRPLLLKDFVLDDYQILEGKAYGADAVLLIVALLGEAETKRMLNVAQALGLTALIEVHDEVELKSALAIGAKLVGVNNRDLKTLEVSLDVSRRLAPLLSTSLPDVFSISESGVESADDIRDLSGYGYRGFLIGTSLMRGGDSGHSPGEALARLRAKIN